MRQGSIEARDLLNEAGEVLRVRLKGRCGSHGRRYSLSDRTLNPDCAKASACSEETYRNLPDAFRERVPRAPFGGLVRAVLVNSLAEVAALCFGRGRLTEEASAGCKEVFGCEEALGCA